MMVRGEEREGMLSEPMEGGGREQGGGGRGREGLVSER